MNGKMYSTTELMGILKLNDRKNFIKTYLHPAFNDDLIALLYPGNPKRKGQKYYLTEKGKNVLKASDNKQDKIIQ
jgi:ATP-dependent DNA helicase RecG